MTVYLDNAATSYPKPRAVLTAVTRAAKTAYGNAGRASHAPAREASELTFDCRGEIASLFGGESERVVFAANATAALNLAIKALTPRDSHLLLSDMEHNAVLRPVTALQARGVSHSFYRVIANGIPDKKRDGAAVLASLTASLRPNTVGVIACHRSNVLPIEAPLEAIGQFCKERGLFFIVDASQSAGAAAIDIERMHITALCAPSHKGLYGIRGTGFVLFGKAVRDETLATLIEGGSGSDSRNALMPELLPERLEAGTLPVEAIAALAEGVRFVKKTKEETIGAKEAYLAAYLKSRLLRLPSVRVYCPARSEGSIVLFNVAGKSAEEVADLLDSRGIALRAGLHCAPLAHRLVETETIGALRASFGYDNTEADADSLVYALKQIGK